MRHLTSLFDISANEIEQIFRNTKDLKSQLQQKIREPKLQGFVLAMLFEKPSLRTRVSFEAAMTHLGGTSLYLGRDVGWGTRESIPDFARVLSQYADVIVCRSKSHESIEELASHSTCPIVNGLSDLCHPCQALADLYTLQELHGSLHDRKLAFVGDPNNVARSLAIACGRLGVRFTLASPEGYDFDATFRQRLADESLDTLFETTRDVVEAVQGASGIYTDVWASMGQEDEQEERVKAFTPFQVNKDVMAAAPSDACFLHCLPARRGEEVTDEVIDGRQSVVIQQASNRLHAQKGLLAWLLGS